MYVTQIRHRAKEETKDNWFLQNSSIEELHRTGLDSFFFFTHSKLNNAENKDLFLYSG